jgi:hypothetical protein
LADDVPVSPNLLEAVLQLLIEGPDSEQWALQIVGSRYEETLRDLVLKNLYSSSYPLPFGQLHAMLIGSDFAGEPTTKLPAICTSKLSGANAADHLFGLALLLFLCWKENNALPPL